MSAKTTEFMAAKVLSEAWAASTVTLKANPSLRAVSFAVRNVTHHNLVLFRKEKRSCRAFTRIILVFTRR